MPGMFAQSMMSGAAATISVMAADRARGVTDRFRSMPMAQSAVVIGRSTADIVNALLERGALAGCGLMIGWSSCTGLGPTLAAVGLLLLLRFAMIRVGIHLGLIVSREAAGATWALLFPLSMISNTFVSPSQMPAWLGTVAEWNPLSANGSPGPLGDGGRPRHAGRQAAEDRHARDRLPPRRDRGRGAMGSIDHRRPACRPSRWTPQEISALDPTSAAH